MDTATPIKKPYGHVRNINEDDSMVEYYVKGPEGAVSFRVWKESRSMRNGSFYTHKRKPTSEDDFGPSSCDLIGGVCYGRNVWIASDRAFMALETSIEAMWAYLEECYTDFLLKERNA